MLVQVSGQRLAIPPVCACCGARSEAVIKAAHSRVHGKKVIHTNTHSWNFEYCNACVAHIHAWPAPTSTGMGCLLALATCGISIPVLAVSSATKKARTRSLMTPSCFAPGPCVSFVNWHGTTQTFDLANPAYAAEFMIANRGHLINLDPATRNWLQDQVQARRLR